MYHIPETWASACSLALGKELKIMLSSVFLLLALLPQEGRHA